MKKSKHRTANSEQPTAPPTGPRPRAVVDLADVEAFCGEPLRVRSIVRDQPFDFTGRRLKPAEARQVQLLLERAVPPIVTEEGKEPRYNLADEEYKRNHEQHRREARALALWLAFPCFQAQAAKELAGKLPKMPGEVMDWLENRHLEEDTLEALFEALTRSEVQSFLGFTSGNSSPKS